MDRAFFLAVLTALIWGFAPAFEKFGLSGKIDPYLGVVIRTIPITVISLAGLAFMGRLSSIATVDAKSAFFVIAGGIIAGLAGQIAFYSALRPGMPWSSCPSRPPTRSWHSSCPCSSSASPSRGRRRREYPSSSAG